jgi:hypothetical protein
MTINYDIQQLIFELTTIIGDELTLHSKRHISCINAVKLLKSLVDQPDSANKTKAYHHILKQVQQYL